MIEYRTVDKLTWGDGPWQDEPDKRQWTDAATGLPCLLVRNQFGSLCGYVGVAPAHPWHGKAAETFDVEVHGGLTYSAGCVPGGDPATGICHIPEPGEPDDVWWFGFDCGHSFDLAPAMASYLSSRGHYPFPEEQYRTVGFVEAHCAGLAVQLVAAAA